MADAGTDSSETTCGCNALNRHEHHYDQHHVFDIHKQCSSDSHTGTSLSELIYIPGGKFTMGSDKPSHDYDGESPAISVEVKPFFD